MQIEKSVYPLGEGSRSGGAVSSYRRVFVGGFAMLIIAAVVTVFISIEWRVSSRIVFDVANKRDTLTRLEVLMHDSESDLRGYLLTRDPEYLNRYEGAEGKANEILGLLHEQAQENAIQMRRLLIVEALIQRKFDIMGELLEASRSDGQAEAIKLLQTGTAEQAMQDLTAQFDLLVRNDTTELAQSQDDLFNFAAILLMTTLLCLALAAGLGLVAARAVIQSLAQERSKSAGLSDQNLSLVKEMEERAAELESAQRQAEDQMRRADTLLRDVHHRVGNSLQLVAAFLGLQANQTKNPDALDSLRRARSRVLAIASAQRRLRLTESGDAVEADRYVSSIVEDLKANATGPSNVKLESEAETVQVPSKDAVSIGVIITELVTNALKYGFPNKLSGTVHVSLTTRHGGETMVLQVKDDGIGLDTEASVAKGGLGSRIVDRLAAALGGEVERDVASDDPERPGTRVAIIFPRSDLF